MARRQSQQILAGCNGDSSIQVHPDGGGASPLAAGSRRQRHGGGDLCIALDSIFVIYVFGMFHVKIMKFVIFGLKLFIRPYSKLDTFIIRTILKILIMCVIVLSALLSFFNHTSL
jgi:hypothetical protein